MKKTFLIAVIFLIGFSASAQSLKDILSKVSNSEVAKTVVEKAIGEVLPADIKGQWSYSGIAVKFESDDILKSAAASLAATQVEEKMDEYAAKVGIKAGTFTFIFNEDNTFSASVRGKSFKGTYTLVEDSKSISLQFGKSIGIKPFNAAISVTGNQLDLLFTADKLLELLGKLTSNSNNSTLKTIGSIVNQYDGMKLGLELKK